MTAENVQKLPKYRPGSDIVEMADGFHIFMDMPGVKKDDLLIDLNEKEVTVSAMGCYPPDPAAESSDPEKGGRRYTHVEFGGGCFERTFTISDVVDREKITAKLEHGVLNLYLPKSEESKPKRISINVG